MHTRSNSGRRGASYNENFTRAQTRAIARTKSPVEYLVDITFISLLALLLIITSGCGEDMSFRNSGELSQSQAQGLKQSESFTQGLVSKKLDVLMIVDNSTSMADEQLKLGDRIDSFLATLADVDWQIGITTTDVSDQAFGLKGSLLQYGNGSRVLTKRTPNYQALFKNTVVRAESNNCVSPCPSGNEQPLKAAIQAIEKRNSVNAGLFRDGSDIGLLILSDEDEMSTGPINATSPQAVLNAVTAAWGDAKQLLTYGMIIQPGDTACMNAQPNAANYGTFVKSLALLTGGMVGSICAADYAPTLGLLANHALALLDYVQIRYIPVQDTMKITFTPAHETTFTLEGRRIRFANPPPKNTVIQIDYTVK